MLLGLLFLILSFALGADAVFLHDNAGWDNTLVRWQWGLLVAGFLLLLSGMII